MRGKFIVIDGMDGSGKGEQIKLLKEKYHDGSVVFTREPGGTEMAEKIRELLLDPNGPKSNPLCDSFLFWAARASHVEQVIYPTLQAGKHVICDRYDSSSVFQLYGEEFVPNRRPDLIDLTNRMFIDIRIEFSRWCEPDLYLILDLSAERAYERIVKSADKGSRFDIKPLGYHERVRRGFQNFARWYPSRMIDADHSIYQVADSVQYWINETFQPFRQDEVENPI